MGERTGGSHMSGGESVTCHHSGLVGPGGAGSECSYRPERGFPLPLPGPSWRGQGVARGARAGSSRRAGLQAPTRLRRLAPLLSASDKTAPELVLSAPPPPCLSLEFSDLSTHNFSSFLGPGWLAKRDV
ncbi:ubiquitin domain-containing protein 1 [Platysternon megacephalum]|uniref:Ubiquitin domain-containing protein 1 n=1 Tax=Platysternon megacephalum TaxID=55544 RepID=A0A4D9EPG0_9SAUR|nr:ubiquitin domain-containing protein 1 [Platysternon megacephalum]